ncbi:Xylan glycosyltransferase muci21 [Turnera subulata]|uniref:Xylan glycosyltransferase muci21 n=1 Tax=Turnera subulata TaxID=218843 RepID=A0A9Q0GBY7_9ROSI|nr:Xylan glycosyltransferase muci21 [Turnera subulata]
MVHYYRYHPLKKGDHPPFVDDEALSFVCANSGYYKRTTRPKLISLLLLSLLSCCLILAPHFFCSSSALTLLYSFGAENDKMVAGNDAKASLCSSVPHGTICCDRSSTRSDICIMKGDVRTHHASSSLFLYTSTNSSASSINSATEQLQHEKIKPYTRKWEANVMDTIDELNLISKKDTPEMRHHCDVMHDVPAVFFSTGGYTGNVYHEFNDGILPLYITSQHFNKKVVFVILEYHDWWVMKYADILPHLSDYPAIDFSGDKRTHCFPEAIVGLRIHDELTVDPALMPGSKNIVDFRNLLDRAYRPRVKSLIKHDERREVQERLRQKVPSSSPSSESSLESRKELKEARTKRPKLVILSRWGSRAITNEDMLVKVAQDIGFVVEVLRPERTTELARIYMVLNSSDVMVGVHGAAMTHFLFMRPGSVFIQIIPLGTDWAADAYYGEPARKLGLKYTGYKILPRESSLYEKYDKSDPVLQDPESVNSKGWEYTKKIYLESQNVRLNLNRFRKQLARAYAHSSTKMNRHSHRQSK